MSFYWGMYELQLVKKIDKVTNELQLVKKIDKVTNELQLVKKIDKVTNVLLHTYCTST